MRTSNAMINSDPHSVVADPVRMMVRFNLLHPTLLSETMTGARVDPAKWLGVSDEAVLTILRQFEFRYRVA